MGHVGGRRFSVGEIHAASKPSSANGSYLNVWDFDISTAEFPQQKKRASLVWIGPKGPKGLFTPKTRVFSAAEILLRIYQNPIHLNGTHWRTRYWKQREFRRRKNVVRQRAPFKCMGFWYIRSRISAAEKTLVSAKSWRHGEFSDDNTLWLWCI